MEKYFQATRDYGVLTSDPAQVAQVQKCFDCDWKREPFHPHDDAGLRVEPGKCPSSRLQVHRRRAQNENVFLRHQLNIALRSAPPRLRLYSYDRALLIGMTRLWPGLLGMAQVVQPETILRWHRAGFKPFWRWKSRNRVGRPKIDRGLRDLIQRMSRENPLWGASLSF